jgi:hypothetical protein
MMKLFENTTIEEVIVDFAVAVLATLFVALCAWVASPSWRWAWHFISTTRQRRRHENYIEVRRRVMSADYLAFTEARAT